MGLALPPLLAMGVNQQQNNGGRGSSNNSGTGHNNGNSSSDSEDDWGDESWTVDCPCGVNYDDGEEMVECDECGVWVHTSCCQVPKSLPTYLCDKCKEKEKKRKEKEESEVAQMLVELPGKTVSFEDNRNGLLVAPELTLERRVHEHGVPGGDSSIFAGVSGVFSQHLWKCAGYVPKLLQLQYLEVPKWQDDEQRPESFSLFDPPQRPPSPKAASPKSIKKVKDEARSTNGDTEMLLDLQRKDKQGKKLEAMRHSKHSKHKFRKDDKMNPQLGKRLREDVTTEGLRKKMKASPDAVKKGLQQSPKNPKAMKKSAVQEFMDVDVRLCSKCQKPEDGEGCGRHECLKPTRLRKQPDTEAKPDGSRVENRKHRHSGGSMNVSPETASTEHLKQEVQESREGELGDHSSLYKLCKAATAMKPPSDDGNNEEKKPLQSQLTIKTGTSLKSDIPSPASINSGGPSPGTAKAATEKTIPKPANKLMLKPALMKLSSSSKPTSFPSTRKPDSKHLASGRVITETSTSVKYKSTSSSQLKPCKNVLSQSKSGQARVLKKHPGIQKASGSHRDVKDEIPSSPTLNDKEVALLLHQQLNSSPRVPRVPRGRQSSQQASAPSNMSNRRSGGNPSAAQKDHRLTWRKKCKDDQLIRENCSKYGESPLLTAMNRKLEEAAKSDDDTASSRTESPEPSDDADEDYLAEKNTALDQTKQSSPLSEADDKEKSYDPGFLDDVLRSKINQDAVSPPHSVCCVNGERYVEA